jgi:hypothetical protein
MKMAKNVEPKTTLMIIYANIPRRSLKICAKDYSIGQCCLLWTSWIRARPTSPGFADPPGAAAEQRATPRPEGRCPTGPAAVGRSGSAAASIAHPRSGCRRTPERPQVGTKASA